MLATPTITVERGQWGPHNKLVIPRGKMSGIYSDPPGFFSTFNGSDVTLTGIYPRKPTDGVDVIYSGPYSPRPPRSTSLLCTKDDSKYISFLSVMKVEVNFKELIKEGECQEFRMIPLYQSHVLWCYAPRITAVEDGKYSLSLGSVGPHLSVREIIGEIDVVSEDSEDSDKDEGARSDTRAKMPFCIPDSGPKNAPPGLRAPPITTASLWIANDKADVTFGCDLEQSPDGSLVMPLQLTREELRSLTYDGKQLYLCWNIIVPRSYFDLSSVIDLTVMPSVPASAEATVAKILRGEKPKGWDFTITGGFRGSGDASVVYYMHSAALESKSLNAKAAAAVPASGDRGARFSLDAEGLAAAVRIAYGVEVPLPDTFDRNMAFTLELIFMDHFTSVVVPQWEREICRRALALDIRNPSSSSMVELLRLLDAIWEMPYGYFPVAKRVVVGVLADMMHVGPHSSAIDFVQNTVLPSFHESGMNPSNLLTILASLAIHLNTIPTVTKMSENTPDNKTSSSDKSGAETTNENPGESEAEPTPPTPSGPAHVELEMPPTELPYPEESIDIDPASVPAARKCAIL